MRTTRIDILSLLDLAWAEKFSLFQAEFLKASFESVVRRKIECTITDNSM
jgi:hypothetical protein